MSEHMVPIPPAGSLTEGFAGLTAEVTRLIREPVRTDNRGTEIVYVFTPDLTAQEVTRFAQVLAAARSRVHFDADERAALESDIDGLRTFHGLASPTAAQTAQATKAIIRVLRAVLRD